MHWFAPHTRPPDTIDRPRRVASSTQPGVQPRCGIYRLTDPYADRQAHELATVVDSVLTDQAELTLEAVLPPPNRRHRAPRL